MLYSKQVFRVYLLYGIWQKFHKEESALYTLYFISSFFFFLLDKLFSFEENNSSVSSLLSLANLMSDGIKAGEIDQKKK